MEIQVLGGLTVRIHGRRQHLGTPKQQLVLAMLALHAGRLVTVDQLVDELWPDNPPRSAVPNVRTYAANLRRSLESATGGQATVVREQGAYRLPLDENQVDLTRLSAQWLRARELADAGDTPRAGELLGLDSLPVLANLGLTLRCLGRYEEAMAIHRLHLFLARARQDQFHLSNALGHLGGVRYRMGEGVQAKRLLRASLALRDRAGYTYARAEALSDLAGTYRLLGRYEEALRSHHAALEAAANDGERHVQAEARNELAMTLRAMGRFEESATTYREALGIATRIAHPYEQGRALNGLAEHLVAVDPADARRYWQRALAIFERMGVPERHEVGRRVSGGTADHP